MTTDTTAPAAKAGPRQWLGLAVLALPTLLISLDQSVLFLALPHLAEALHPNGTQTLWIMDSYGFAIAGLLITMGSLGDRIGRRRLLLIGAVAMSLASLAAAFSTSAEALILSRGLLGIAAATIMPSTLALIRDMFADPGQRGRAIAVWAGCFMGGTALGPVVGGILLEYFWWGSVFLIGVPIMVLLLIAGPLLLPEHRNPGAGRIDLVSAGLSLVAILAIIYALKEFARHGFAGTTLAVLSGGLVVEAVFVARQYRLADPLLDLRLFRVGAFGAALVLLTVSMLGTGGGYLFITGFLQMVAGFSPLEAGLLMVPAAVASVVAAQLAPVLVRRFALGTVVAAALLSGFVGYLLLAFVDPVAGLPLLLAGFVTVFVGVGGFGSLGTNLVVGSVPPERAGSAAALSSIAGDLGNALGVAILGSLGTAVYRDTIAVPATIPAAAAGSSLEDALAAAARLSASESEALLTAARTAFTNGLNTIAVVCAVLAAGCALLALTVLRRRA